MSALLESLQWRYATKKFDPTKKLSVSELNELTEALRLSASSYGLQPYKFMVISDPELRAKVRAHAWGQAQVTDASHLIVLLAEKVVDETHVDAYIENIAKTRGTTAESLATFKSMMMQTVNGRTPQELAEWAKKQGYIALGFLLSAAAHLRIDTCPMEGFSVPDVDNDLGLPARNLTAFALCPVGFRAADDETASMKKVRFPKEALFLQS